MKSSRGRAKQREEGPALSSGIQAKEEEPVMERAEE